jgi:hypothetical protein
VSAGNLLPFRFVHSWERIFAQRGGIVPTAMQEIVPVTLIDNQSKGGYTPATEWHAANSLAALAANFSTLFVFNQDPLGSKTVVVVDRMTVSTGATIFLFLGTSTVVLPTAALGFLANLADAQVNPAGAAQLQSVGQSQAQLGAAIGGLQIPNNGPGIIDGPWTLSPGMMMAVSGLIVNFPIAWYLQGRYYGDS